MHTSSPVNKNELGPENGFIMKILNWYCYITDTEIPKIIWTDVQLKFHVILCGK